MINTKKSGFTLIELIVAISIFFLISMIAFAPYSFYLNKSKVKHTDKEISQSIYEAKNKAINGSATSTGNVSIGIYFDSTENNNYSYKLLSFPHNISNSTISPEEGILIEESQLQPGIELGLFKSRKDTLGHIEASKGLIFFRSVTGSGLVVTWNEDGSIRREVPYVENEITLEYSYKGANDGLLTGDLQYFQDTQIVDY